MDEYVTKRAVQDLLAKYYATANIKQEHILRHVNMDLKALPADDVAAMLALVKIARISSGRFKEDNWVDLAGYAACGGEIQANMKPDLSEVKVNVEKLLHDLHQPCGVRLTAEYRGLAVDRNPICPECGTPCATYYVDEDNNVCGCENCLSRTDAVQYILDEEDDDEDC